MIYLSIFIYLIFEISLHENHVTFKNLRIKVTWFFAKLKIDF